MRVLLTSAGLETEEKRGKLTQPLKEHLAAHQYLCARNTGSCGWDGDRWGIKRYFTCERKAHETPKNDII